MVKTLADMTAEERADCVGMWALIEGISLAVITEADETSTCVVIYPEWQSNTVVHLNEMVAPRYDLPRAWTPDGAPDPAQALAYETWEYSAQTARGENWETCTNSETHLEEWWADKDDAEWAAGRLQEQGHKTRIVSRRVSTVEVCCQS